MIFWRIFNNKLYTVNEVDRLGWPESNKFVIPDEYLSNQQFVICRTCHGLGDWGIISSLPRILKSKYPNCKVYIPSESMLKTVFNGMGGNWFTWNNPFVNAHNIMYMNPYVDGFVDSIEGDIFHDHYRIYNETNSEIPLAKQMLKFWQFDDIEIGSILPELYFTDAERKLGDSIIKEYVKDQYFGGLLISNRYKPEMESILVNTLKENDLPYFYFTNDPIDQTPFNFINKVLDLRHINTRIQLYIRSKAYLNIGVQCGVLDSICRYSKVFAVPHGKELRENYLPGINYLNSKEISLY